MNKFYKFSQYEIKPEYFKQISDKLLEERNYRIINWFKPTNQPKIKSEKQIISDLPYIPQQIPELIDAIDNPCHSDTSFSTSASDSIKISGKENKNLEDALEQFQKREKLSEQETKDLTDKFKKEDAEINHADYTIKMDCQLGYSRTFGHIYHDAPYSFVLCYQLRGIATIAFGAQEGGILVSQIQGARGEKDILKKIKWERMLLALVCKWAKENEIPEARILPHHKNKWNTVKEFGKMTYDVTAKRCGFKYDEKVGLYVKKIEA